MAELAGVTYEAVDVDTAKEPASAASGRRSESDRTGPLGRRSLARARARLSPPLVKPQTPNPKP